MPSLVTYLCTQMFAPETPLSSHAPALHYYHQHNLQDTSQTPRARVCLPMISMIHRCDQVMQTSLLPLLGDAEEAVPAKSVNRRFGNVMHKADVARSPNRCGRCAAL